MPNEKILNVTAIAKGMAGIVHSSVERGKENGIAFETFNQEKFQEQMQDFLHGNLDDKTLESHAGKALTDEERKVFTEYKNELNNLIKAQSESLNDLADKKGIKALKASNWKDFVEKAFTALRGMAQAIGVIALHMAGGAMMGGMFGAVVKDTITNPYRPEEAQNVLAGSVAFGALGGFFSGAAELERKHKKLEADRKKENSTSASALNKEFSTQVEEKTQALLEGYLKSKAPQVKPEKMSQHDFDHDKKKTDISDRKSFVERLKRNVGKVPKGPSRSS